MAKRAKTIDLLRVVALLQEHITPALCRTVFGAVRTTERQRVWTLEALIRFWTAVVLRAPKALTQALVDSLEGRDPTYPRIEASPEAFFQRCRDLRPAFFAEVFQRFTARLVTAVPPRYAAEVAPVRARFAAIVILDGSRLAAIAHRLKLLWNERAVVLPGCLLGVYDLGRGLCRQLTFCADAAASEMTRAKAAVAALGRDTLVLGDRLYGPADFFAALGHQHCWGVVRRNRQLSLHKLQRLRKRRIHSGVLEDWLVRAGTGATAPRQLRRYIRWRRGGTRYEVLTNVLAPARLSAEEALDLYPYRWSVERMFFDLKEVLNLNRLYAANPNAVAMQVYAAAIVYNALRVAQSDGAAQVGWAPEQLSPAKFYPKVATATYLHLHRQQWEREIRTRYRHLHLRLVAGRSSRPGIHRWPPRPAGGPVLGATTGGPGAPDAKRARVAGGAGLAGQGSARERTFILPTILRFTKAKVSPRAMRYEFEPGQDARLVLEPWEQRIPLRGAEHGYAEPRVIRTRGRRRLSLLEPILYQGRGWTARLGAWADREIGPPGVPIACTGGGAGVLRMGLYRVYAPVKPTTRATCQRTAARSDRRQGRHSGARPINAFRQPLEIRASRFDHLPPGF